MLLPARTIPWAWAVAAIVIAFVELHMPGNYLIWIACAAAITSILSFSAELSFTGQLAIFIASSLVSCGVGYFVYRKVVLSKKGSPIINRRDIELIGAVGVATEPFANGQGKVRIGDTVWLAESAHPLSGGTPVIVAAVRGTTLLVESKTLI